MMNSKIEKLLFGVLWYINLISLRLLIPIQKIDYKITAQFFIISFTLTSLIFFIYSKIRNKKIMKTVTIYNKNNEFDVCLSYLGKKLQNTKKWIGYNMKEFW